MSPTLWSRDPAAIALLAEAAQNPPARVVRTDRCGDSWEECTGRVARDLRRIRNRYLETALKVSDTTGDDSAFLSNMLLTVEIAVDAAVGDYRALAGRMAA